MHGSIKCFLFKGHQEFKVFPLNAFLCRSNPQSWLCFKYLSPASFNASKLVQPWLFPFTSIYREWLHQQRIQCPIQNLFAYVRNSGKGSSPSMSWKLVGGGDWRTCVLEVHPLGAREKENFPLLRHLVLPAVAQQCLIQESCPTWNCERQDTDGWLR